MTGPNTHGLRPPVQATGVRSQQVTGTAMKDSERAAGNVTPKPSRALPVPPTTNNGPATPSGLGLLRRPSTSTGMRRVASLTARDRDNSSPSPSRRGAGSPTKPPMSPTKTPASPSKTPASPSKAPASRAHPPLSPAKPTPGSRAQSQTARPDWLTGDFLESAQALGISVPASPSKRSSAILGSTGTGGGAGARYSAPLKNATTAETSRVYAHGHGEHGRATPDRLDRLAGGRATPVGRATPSSGRQMSMTESSNDEGPEDPAGHLGRSKLERRGAVTTRGSPERKNRSSTLDVTTAGGAANVVGTAANTPSSQLHRRQQSENLIELGPSQVLSSVRPGRLSTAGQPVRTPSTTSSTASHPPTTGPRSRRPQSMFIPTGTPGLTPPVDTNAPTKRTVRRGSISDMVSRYEALASPIVENNPTGSGGSVQRRPSIANKPAGLRVPSGTAAPPRRRSPSPVGASRSPERVEKGSSAFTSSSRVRTSPTEMMREVPIQDGRAPSPAGRRSRPPSPFKVSHPVAQPTPAPAAGRNRTLHTITPPKDAAQETRAPSPPASPDKPYQGVGRLIDQWQKKAGAAEPARPLGARVGRR